MTRTNGDRSAVPEIELTDDEKKNGWTVATLEAYLADREKALAGVILHRAPVRPRWANSIYSPHRWRG